jgi:ribosomal protein L7/L12
MSITSEAKKEVQRLLLGGHKLQAIQYLTETFGVSSEEALMLVEAVEEQNETTEDLTDNDLHEDDEISMTALEGELKNKVIALLPDRKIEAVKLVKAELNVGLKEALEMVEEVQQEIDPNFTPSGTTSGCLAGGFTIFKLVFGFIGLAFLGVAGGIYYFQSQTIANSDLVNGKVVDLVYSTDGGSAPVISYPWQGKEKLYHSNTYSTPPAYKIDEIVPMYVNRNDATDVVVDTFSDRWLLIFIFGLIGFIFTAITVVILFFQKSIKA